MSERYVLWIDDDEMLLERSIDRLRDGGIPCVNSVDIDDAHAFIQSNHSNIIGIIADVMMSPGELLASTDHEGGFVTGFRFFDHLVRHDLAILPHLFFFTNKKYDHGVYSDPAEQRSANVHSKFQYRSRALVELVRQEFDIGNGA